MVKRTGVLEITKELKPPEIHPLSGDIENGLNYLQPELEK